MTRMIQQELQSSLSSSASSSSWSTSSTSHGYTNFEYISRHQLSSDCRRRHHQPIITMTRDTTTTTMQQHRTTNHLGTCTTPLSIKRLEMQSNQNTKRQTRLVLSSLLKVKRNLTNANGRRRSGSSLSSSSSSLSSDSSSATMIIRKSPMSTRCYNQLNVSNDETELELSAYKKRRPSQSNYENQMMSPIHAVRPPPPIPSIMPKPIMTSSRTDLVLLSPPSPPPPQILQWQPIMAFTNNTYGIHMSSSSLPPSPALQQHTTNTSRDELDRFVEQNKYRFERIKTKRKPNVNKRLVDSVSCGRQPRVTRCNMCLV